METELPDEWRRDIDARVASWLESIAGENVTLLLRASEAKNRAGLDHLPLTLRIVRSPMRRLVGLDGLVSIAALVDAVPADAPQERELQGEVASLAAELGQQVLAMERWARIADRLAEPRDRARAWLGASEAAQQLERADEARAHLESARASGSDDPVLLLELDAADAAITRWLEHRPEESGSLTSAALERARALAASTGRTEALEPRFQSAYQRTLVLACVDAMQANEPEVVLPLVEEMTRVAAGGGIEASLQASLRRGSALTHLGRLAEAEERLAAAWLEARRAFLSGIALDIGSWLAQTSYMRGRLIEAQEVADECAALADADRRAFPSSHARADVGADRHHLRRRPPRRARRPSGDVRGRTGSSPSHPAQSSDRALELAAQRSRERRRGARADRRRPEGFSRRTMHPMRHRVRQSGN